jgi:hypothetical protein
VLLALHKNKSLLFVVVRLWALGQFALGLLHIGSQLQQSFFLACVGRRVARAVYSFFAEFHWQLRTASIIITSG